MKKELKDFTDDELLDELSSRSSLHFTFMLFRNGETLMRRHGDGQSLISVLEIEKMDMVNEFLAAMKKKRISERGTKIVSNRGSTH